MKKFTVLMAISAMVALAGSAWAAHLVCDPNPGATSYVFTGQPAPLPEVASGASVKPDGSLYLDVSMMPVGTYPLTVKACMDDPIWGTVCSGTVPFTLVRPVLSAPTTPVNVKLIQ